MPLNNERQAEVLEGAEVVRNPRGTAPAQWLATEYNGRPRLVMLLPGPPRELKPLFEAEMMPRLRRVLPPAFVARRVLKMAMIGESVADSIASPIYSTRPDVQTTILASGGEVQLHLMATAETQEEAQRRVDSLADALDEAFGIHVFSTEGEPLEQIVGYHLGMRGLTIAVAESCTGGLIGERLTNVAGSSRWFLGGAIVYSNELKTKLAKVPQKLLREHGAVSEPVAKALAEGIREVCGASLGIGVTGIAGPSGGSDEKPVGLVYVAVADERGTEVVERRFPHDREYIRRIASQQALDLVRRRILGSS
jgi:nicotinamide-nucleotide amidase